jgi:hypothetical protein
MGDTIPISEFTEYGDDFQGNVGTENSEIGIVSLN